MNSIRRLKLSCTVRCPCSLISVFIVFFLTCFFFRVELISLLFWQVMLQLAIYVKSKHRALETFNATLLLNEKIQCNLFSLFMDIGEYSKARRKGST